MPASSAPLLPAETQRELDSLLFGPLSNCGASDVQRWRQQGFVFSAAPRTRFGLTQTAGGPCGVLAPVQAWILRRLLFGGVVPANQLGSDVPVSPTPQEQDEALVWALTTILERALPAPAAAQAAQPPTFVLVSLSGSPAADPPSLHVTRVHSSAEVSSFWQSHLAQLHSPMGVLTFVYSLLLTRGVATVRGDMDDSGSFLVGNFGHCAQELVNLCLTGAAVTNTFDGTKVLGDASDPSAFRLKGIPAQNEVGFLTLLEALRYSTVGEYYKSPRSPIWVIGSSNHYTVLFALDRRVGALTTKQVKQRAARTAFDEIDAENNGFIPVTALPALLQKIRSSASSTHVPPGLTDEDVKRRLDPDGLGVILWERVLTVLEQWERQKDQLAAAAVQNVGVFNCGACTFLNSNPQAQTCEICGTPRPPPQAVVAAAAANAAKEAQVDIQNFVLYHFNGIEIPNPSDPSKPKSPCECVRVHVSVVEGGLPPQIQGDAMGEAQGLKEILLTRWPSCILDIEGEAKIS